MVIYIKGEKRRIVFALIMLGVLVFCSLLGGTALGVLAPAGRRGNRSAYNYVSQHSAG